MIRRPPRSTLDRSSAASDVYKRQVFHRDDGPERVRQAPLQVAQVGGLLLAGLLRGLGPVSYTHLRAHETVLDLVCRLLLEKKKHDTQTADLQNVTKD